jgi:hypothetical protein
MNCPEWEERILLHLEGAGDVQAAAHLQDCPACTTFAALLVEDARRLVAAPPEVADVDYATMRAAARREAGARTGRRRVLAALTIAATVLVVGLAVRRELPPSGRPAPLPRPTLALSRLAPPVVLPHVVRPARPHHARTQAEIDRQFAAYLRSLEESQHPSHPPATDPPGALRIATSNPQVTILWIEESKGDPHE